MSWKRLMTAIIMAVILACTPRIGWTQTLRMWTMLDPNGKDPREIALKKIIGQFEAANPGVTITVEPQIWDQMTTKFLAANQAGTAPDITWVNVPTLPQVVKAGALANLDDYFMKNWTARDVADLDDVFWQFSFQGNGHYGIAHSRAYAGLIYRIDLLQQAGINPDQLRSWPGLIAAAKKLTVRDAAGNVTRWGLGQAYLIDKPIEPLAFSMILEAQKHLLDDQCRADWANPVGLNAMTAQLDMVREDKITPPGAVSLNVEDLYDQFAAGRAAIIRGTSVRVPKMIGLLGADKVGFTGTPSFAGDTFSPSGVGGWYVGAWSKGKYIALAAKFIEAMSSPQSDRIWSMEAGAAPNRKSTVAENATWFAEPAHAYLAAASKLISGYSWLPPKNCAVYGWSEALNGAAQAILTGGAEPAAALRRAAEQFDRQNRLQ